MLSTLKPFAVAATLFVAAVAEAATIPVFNTGNSAAGAVVPHGTIGDLHYSLVSVPPGSTLATRAITSTGGFPIPPYLGDNLNSTWIGPNNDEDLNGPIGLYHYQMTLNLAGFDHTTANLTGQLACDNDCSMFLNGNLVVLVPFVNGLNLPGDFSFGHWTDYVVPTSQFIAGINTFDFYINNVEVQFGPTALRNEFRQNSIEELDGSDPGNGGGFPQIGEPGGFTLLLTCVILLVGFARWSPGLLVSVGNK